MKVGYYQDGTFHLLNRGTEKRKIFVDRGDYIRFLISLRLLNSEQGGLMLRYKNLANSNKNKKNEVGLLLKESDKKPLVEIIAYCLNPNHFHLILKQITENGIVRFVHKLGTSYTNYFNKKYERKGVLFQGKTKAVHIGSNDQLLYLSGYVNANCKIHGLVEAEEYSWSSYKDYLGIRRGVLCKKDIILEQFKNNIEDYKKFVDMVTENSKGRKEMEKFHLEK